MKLSVIPLVISSLSVSVLSAPAGPAKSEVSNGRPLSKRQQLDGQLGMLTAAARMLPEMKPAKTVEVPPQSGREGAKRVKVFYGPIKLYGANEKKPLSLLSAITTDPNGNSWVNVIKGGPSDVTLLFTNATLQYEDGTLATTSSGVYNHHVAYVSTKKFVPQFMSCPGQPLGRTTPSVIMGAAEEETSTRFSTLDYKFDAGYYVGADDKILVTGEVVNYSNATKYIYSVIEYEYIPGRVNGFRDTITQVVQVNQCEGNSLGLTPPPGKEVYSMTSAKMTVLQDGYFLSGRAHMHDGGTGVQMLVNDNVICTSEAIYGGAKGTLKTDDGKIWETMSGVKACESTPVLVKKGDSVLLKANYDLVKHPQRKHAGEKGSHSGMMAEEMAILSFSFAY